MAKGLLTNFLIMVASFFFGSIALYLLAPDEWERELAEEEQEEDEDRINEALDILMDGRSGSILSTFDFDAFERAAKERTKGGDGRWLYRASKKKQS